MSEQGIDFDELYEQMKEEQLDQSERPAIWGGEFPADRLNDFLNAWQTHLNAMPYRIWEHVSHIEFADAPAQPEFLQRADIFGEGGHLSLRRDIDRWLWHYIGTQANPMPNTTFNVVDFWVTHPNCQLRRYAESVVLWGKREEGAPHWSDNRVAAANLNYPLNTNGRVHLHFWRYTERGQTVFVWYRALSDKPV
ncbi:type III-D CRISPR-associated protein Csx19 [Chloroflexus sp.]|uniref:type III-D CRISPR-associated protein Csx19 n=1 Tax=Chloroflexus sp. TaxID=1904827 RepID=UPI00263A3285|nr:CRISPR-associated protein Csx19 [uncultured Chloroflexus sp.]